MFPRAFPLPQEQGGTTLPTARSFPQSFSFRQAMCVRYAIPAAFSTAKFVAQLTQPSATVQTSHDLADSLINITFAALILADFRWRKLMHHAFAVVSSLTASYVMPTITGKEAAQLILRWFHIIAGIAWVGLLYFFNLINVPFMKQVDAAAKPKIFQTLDPARPELVPLEFAGDGLRRILVLGTISGRP